MNKEKYPIIIPTTTKDYLRVKRDLKALLDYLPAKEIVFIGPASLEEPVKADAVRCGIGDKVRFLNEEELLSLSYLTEVMRDRLASEGYTMAENSRPGWYYQQFLKMSFSEVCDDEYYMSWDADTLPLRHIDMFDEFGKPIFDTKAELMPGYFYTIQKLFGFNKVIEQSFISEHMLFNKMRMHEMIEEIESLPIKGKTYYEKVIYSLSLDNVRCGFSEFETFGSWMTVRYPDEYTFREWKSMRKAGFFIKPDDFSEEDKVYLSKDYDAVTFEGYHKYVPVLAEMFRNPEYRAEISAKEFYQILIEEGVFGKAEFGGIADEDGAISPV